MNSFTNALLQSLLLYEFICYFQMLVRGSGSGGYEHTALQCTSIGSHDGELLMIEIR